MHLTIISLGCGRQSTAMALLAAHGEISPTPDCAIFADTGWEGQETYETKRWLSSPNVLPFPVHTVSAGNIKEDHLKGLNSTGQRFASMPLFVEGGQGKGRRQCTREYKIDPITRKVRELLGLSKGEHATKHTVEQWIGISTDEAIRMKPARQKWITNRWPLIELEMSRHDCERWMEKSGYPIPGKSSCIGCPFHNDGHWRNMKRTKPLEFADAVAFDKAIRHGGSTLRGTNSQQYLHRSCKPLGEVDFRSLEDAGQINMFNNECEGMCGV